MSFRAVRTYIPKCPGKGCDTPINELYGKKGKFPELWGAVLMSCAKSQTEILTDLWSAQFPVDEDVVTAWQAIVHVGLVPQCLDPTSRQASDLFRAAYQGVVSMKGM